MNTQQKRGFSKAYTEHWSPYKKASQEFENNMVLKYIK